MRKIIVSFLLILSVQAAFAQKKIVFEKLRCFSSNPPVTQYLQDSSIVRTILSQLNATLLKHKGLPIADTTKLKIEFLDFNYLPGPIKLEFTDKDPSVLHLYIDLFEEDPFYFFRKITTQESDSTLQARTKSVFAIAVWLVNGDKKIELQEKLDAVITEAETPGMGIPYDNGLIFSDLSVLPKVFTAFLKTSTNILFDPKNEEDMVELKLQPAFLADNYILPKTLNQPRTFVVTKKGFSTYQSGGSSEMIRVAEPAYEEIVLKGKNAQKYPPDLIIAIRNTNNFSRSDYVFLRQDARDVIRDKNYLLKLAVQMDPAIISIGEEGYMFTNFLSGDIHCLYNDSNMVAKFSIQKKAIGNNDISPSLIGNGYDTVSFYRIKNVTRSNWKLGYDYLVTGRIGNRAFTIKCGPMNLTKEIFLEDKLVCIAQGKFTVQKFVLFDASLSPELLNQLFIIGFNRFFE
jgi:hypothetical protein